MVMFFVATKAPQLKVHHSPEPNPEAGKSLRTAESERDAYAVWNEWYAAAKGGAIFLRASPSANGDGADVEGAPESLTPHAGSCCWTTLIRWSSTTPAIAKRIAAG